MKYLILLAFLTVGCSNSSDSLTSNDLKDCKEQTYQLSELNTYDRLPNKLSITTIAGEVIYLDVSEITGVKGKITVQTCKAYVSGTTLYTGEKSFVSKMVIVKE